MSPAAAAPRGAERYSKDIQFVSGDSSIGIVLVAQTDKGVVAVLIGDDAEQLRQDLENRFPDASLLEGSDDLRAIAAEVIRFIESPVESMNIPLDLPGTEFQRSVWNALREIPAGSTVTYTEIAERLGHPRSVRAVGQACAANPVAVIIPCHRVVGSDGSLAGYRWGVERKRTLLEREGVAVAAMRPTRLGSSTAVALPDRSFHAPAPRSPR